MKDYDLTEASLGDDSRSLRGGRTLGHRGAASLARAFWNPRQNPVGFSTEDKRRLERFWSALGNELGLDADALQSIQEQNFVRLFCSRALNSPLAESSDHKILAEIRANYLQWVIRECAPLRLQAIDQNAIKLDKDKHPLGLTSVYVDLHLDFEIPEYKALTEYLKTPASRLEQKMRPVSALEALAAHNRCVLLGVPGSGKSTFTAFVALQLAEAGLQPATPMDQLGSWWTHGPLLPVRVVLRQFAAQQLPATLECGRAGHLWKYIRSQVMYDTEQRADQTVAWLRETAQGNGALFLLDGVDEVRDGPTRRRMMEAIVEFIGTVGARSRFLVTSRPYAWESLVEAEKNSSESNAPPPREPQDESRKELLKHFPTVYRLAPLAKEQIDIFITRWYEALAQARWLAQAEADRKRDELAAAKDRPDLFALARSPLLLTLMATLHTNRARLPDDRADLYNEVIELLLQRWNETSGADRGLLEALAIPTLKMGDLREAMEQLAFDAHSAQTGKDGLADIAEPVLIKNLRPWLGNSADKAELALAYFESRAGLLLGQGDRNDIRQYTFPHRTFQEYLAACQLAGRHDFCQRAADLSHENPGHWQEVLPLAARHAKAGRGVPAADALVRCKEVASIPVEGIGNADWRAAILAGEMLLEIGLAAVDSRTEWQAVRERIARWLAALIKRGALSVLERARAGRVLGLLGDPRPGVGLLPNGLPDIDWITIPAGKFLMGKGHYQAGDGFNCDLIQQPYRISRYPVTVAQYQAFVDAGGYDEKAGKRFWTKAGWKWRQSEKITGLEDYAPVFQTPNHPRVGVSWFEAHAFCQWLTARSRATRLISNQQSVLLPNEAEWERAARGEKGLTYPWGDDSNERSERCNMANENDIGILHTSAVGLFPTGHAECGAADMAGNVYELCRNIRLDYREDYERKVKEDEHDEDHESWRVARGGSWQITEFPYPDSSFQSYPVPSGRDRGTGFRCVLVGMPVR